MIIYSEFDKQHMQVADCRRQYRRGHEGGNCVQNLADRARNGRGGAAGRLSHMMSSIFALNETLVATNREKVALPSDGTLLLHGLAVTGSIFLAAALLELTVLDTVKGILTKTEGGISLYATAWLYNVINHLLLGPAVYAIGTRLYATAEPCSLSMIAIYSLCVMAIHSVGYYATHRAMHTKALWWAHRYHHKFNKFICPISASAVTQVECARSPHPCMRRWGT